MTTAALCGDRGLDPQDCGGFHCVRAVEGLFCRQFAFFCSFFFFSLVPVQAALGISFLSFFSLRGRGVFVGEGACNGCGLGPWLEASPRLEKRGSPRGLV